MMMQTLEEIKAELEEKRKERLIRRFKFELETGQIPKISINKRYRELEESLAQNQE